MKKVLLGILPLMLLASAGYAKDTGGVSPEASARTYGQNYKDMVLATCIANAYKEDKSAAIDAGSSVSALRDWTEYDLEKGPPTRSRPRWIVTWHVTITTRWSSRKSRACVSIC